LRSSIWPKVNASLRTLSDPGTKHCTIGTPVEVAFEDVNDEISQPKFRKPALQAKPQERYRAHETEHQ
jgi:hypothetical protein